MKRTPQLSIAVVVAAIGLSFYPLSACLNDRDSDTLEREAVGLPPVIQIVTGRFERNPPQFYEMRLKRVAKELAQDPSKLALYDDAAVACDRVGRSGEAIKWIEKKRAHLPPFDPQQKDVREHWYRYHANVGTFWAHRWLHNGANRAKLSEMKIARDHIRRAIQIKPNAHFGREKYQLMAMEWIINPQQKNQSSPTNFLKLYPEEAINHPGEEGKQHLKQLGLDDSVEGLTGLIVLGNAWLSIDVFYALQTALAFENKGSMVELVRLRCRELQNKGAGSLDPNAPSGAELTNIVAPEYSRGRSTYTREQIKEVFTRLRTEADEYQVRRTAYMTERLQRGLHPDTHPDFWKEWRDPGPPPAAPYTLWEKKGSALLILAVAMLSSLTMLGVRRRRHSTRV